MGRYQTLDGAPFEHALHWSDGRVVKRGGFNFILEVSGYMGTPALSAFLTSLVSSLGLLVVTKFVTSFLMHHVLRHRSLYKMVIYEATPDFSDYRDGHPHATAAVEYHINKHKQGDGSCPVESQPAYQLAKLQESHARLHEMCLQIAAKVENVAINNPGDDFSN